MHIKSFHLVILGLFFCGSLMITAGQGNDSGAAKTEGKAQASAEKAPEPSPAKASEPKDEREQMIVALFEDYWKAVMEDRPDLVYSKLCNSFKKDVSMVDFIREDRTKISAYKLRNVKFHTDECVEVGYFYSMASGPMDLKNVPARQIWFVEDGEWRLFEKKKERNIGGMGMSRSRAKPPCGGPKSKVRAKM